MGRSAEAMHRDAADLANRGKFSAAQRLLSRARGLTDDPNLQARIAATLAVTLVRTGHLEEAERECLAALESPGLSGETIAILEAQMGTITDWAGRLDDADMWLSRAIATIRE